MLSERVSCKISHTVTWIETSKTCKTRQPILFIDPKQRNNKQKFKNDFLWV